MEAMEQRHTEETITGMRWWTDRLFSFRTTRPPGFRFAAGQFVRVGLAREDGQLVWRPLSMVSGPADPFLEFYAIEVARGEFSTRLARRLVADRVLVDRMNYGFLTLERFQDGQDLWLLATGTGLAPFLSVLQDPATWRRYPEVIVAHSVRTTGELAYRQEMGTIAADPALGGGARLRYVPVVTREPLAGALAARIPELLGDGRLEQAAGLGLDPGRSRLMICGNPPMVRDTRRRLEAMGYRLSRQASPGHFAVENAW